MVYGYEQLYALGDVIDDTKLVTITLIQEGHAVWVGQTFPASAAVGATVSGTITISNNQATDTLYVALSSSPAVTFSPGSRQSATVTAGASQAFNFSFIMSNQTISITIQIGHVV